MVRKRILFFGRVQGVGFRYTAVWIAREQGLTGWVRNCLDGSVEMEVQGREEDIEILLFRLQENSYIRIREIKMEDLELALGEAKFQTKSTY